MSVGLIVGGIPSNGHQTGGCKAWPFSGGILYLQHYVGYFDFGSYPEYRDAINDWNQPSTPIWFSDGGTPTDYQVKSITGYYDDPWPGLAVTYPAWGCSISSAVVFIARRRLCD